MRPIRRADESKHNCVPITGSFLRPRFVIHHRGWHPGYNYRRGVNGTKFWARLFSILWL